MFWCALTLMLFIAIGLAYRQVLFNFFTGDDYDYLPWLKLSMSQPEVIWRNFHSSWMGNQSTLFYRPLVTASMALEYFIWGPNGLLFRLTNLTFLSCTSVLIALIVIDLSDLCASSQDAKAANRFIAVVAAGLFALYPLHSESIVWIIGRVDSMCSVFILTSLWCYIRWRKSASYYFLAFSIVTAVLAFTCKEMAIVLPLIIAACEFLFGDLFRFSSADIAKWISGKSQTSNKWMDLFQLGLPSLNKEQLLISVNRMAKYTCPFFVLLGFYFLMRRVVLGTFIGGYDNSLLYKLDHANISRFLHALTMLAIPVNQALLGWHSNYVKAWEIGLVICTILSITAFIVRPDARRLICFSLIWFVLALVPVYKIFAISMFLEGSRLGYLATAPLCLFLSCGLALASEKRLVTRLLPILAAGMLGVSAYLLYINNQAWATAGNLANAVQEQLRILYKSTAGDPQVIIVGIPISFRGAYVCLNAIDGMTKFPQIDRDVFHCCLLDSTDPVLPFGFLKDSIWQDRRKIKGYYWNSIVHILDPINLETPGKSSYVWRGAMLKQLLSGNTSGTHLQPDLNGLHITTDHDLKNRPFVELNLKGLPCWSTDFISIKLRSVGGVRQPGKADLLLLYSNEIVNEPTLLCRTQAPIAQTDNQQEINLPLHSVPEWAFGGTCHGMKLLLPVGATLVIDEIAIKTADTVIPKISFAHSTYLENRGTLRLTVDNPKQSLSYNADRIAGATKVMFEITRPGTYFTDHNCKDLNTALLKTITRTDTHGQLDITLDEFPGPGLYQVRARALDKNGKLIGLAGDHVNVLPGN